MAGNNSIQFLRGTSAQRATHTETSLAGQPIYETDTNRLYVGDGVTAVNALRPVNSISNYWEAAEQGFITPSIGETKTIKIGGTAYKVQCIGLNHDDLVSGGKAKTTWQLVDSYTTRRMNRLTTNDGGWRSSEMRSWLNNTVHYTITDEDGNNLSSKIKQVVKRTADGGGTNYSGIVATNDYLFLPSAVEVFGTTYFNGSTQHAYTGEGIQYEFYSSAPIPEPTSGKGQFTPLKEHSSTGTFYTADTSVADGWIDKYGDAINTTTGFRYNYNCIKGIADSTSFTTWWLRSPGCFNTAVFCTVTNSDMLDYDSSHTAHGVSFCFCI